MVRSCGRALLVIAIVVGTTIHHAGAQYGGIPGMPGSGPPGIGFGSPPQMPPKCRALLAIRDELHKHGQAISAANDKRADVRVACKLFRTYIATEAKMLRMLEEDGAACGASAQILRQVRDSHAQAQKIGKQVCDAAARGSMLPGPTLYDALGTPPEPASQDQKPFLFDGLWPPNRRP